MGARCKALCKKTRFHYGFVTNFSRRRCERADVDLNSTVALDAMSRSFGAAQMADSQGTAMVQFVRRAIGPTENGHGAISDLSPLSGVERKSDLEPARSAFAHKRHW
jgi:hypothetical protein